MFKISIGCLLIFFAYPSVCSALCYDMEKVIPCGSTEFPSQAGDFPEPEQSLKRDSNGLIYDSSRNLWWTPCSHTDCSAPIAMDWSSAQNYCQNYAIHQKKWRLPELMELNSLILYNTHTAYINLDLFPDTQAKTYWTANTSMTPRVNQQSKAWYIDFSNGFIFDSDKIQKHLVRCVSDINN